MQNRHHHRAILVAVMLLATEVSLAQRTQRPAPPTAPGFLTQRTAQRIFSTPKPLVRTVSLFNVRDSIELPTVSRSVAIDKPLRPQSVPTRTLEAAPLEIYDDSVFLPPATVTPPALTSPVKPAAMDVIELYNGDLLVTPESPLAPTPKEDTSGVASVRLSPPAPPNVREPAKVQIDSEAAPTPIETEEELPPAPSIETPALPESDDEQLFNFEPVDVTPIDAEELPDSKVSNEEPTAADSEPAPSADQLDTRSVLGTISEPEFKPLLHQSRELAERCEWLRVQLESTQSRSAAASALNTRIKSHFDRAVDKQRKAGLTTTLGLILTHEREHLPDAREWQRDQAAIKEQLHELSEIEFAIERQQRELSDYEESVTAVVAQLSSNEATRANEFQASGRKLVEAHSALLQQALTGTESYSDELTTLDSNTTQLVRTIDDFASYIDKNVLWIRSHDPIGKADFANITPMVTKLSSVGEWTEASASILQALVDRIPLVGLTAIAVLAIFVFRSELRNKLRRLGEASRTDGEIRLLPTVWASLITVVIGLAWPVLIWTTGWAIASSLTATPLAIAIGYAVQKTGLWFATFSIPRAICLPDGLAEQHFRWDSAAVQSVYRGLPKVMTWGLPIVAITAFTAIYDHGAWSGSVGRIAFITGTLVLAYYIRRGLHPERGFVATTAKEGSWVRKLRYPAMLVGVAIPVALGITSAAGYHRSALELIGCFEQSWLTAFLIAVGFGALMLCVDRMVETLETRKLNAFSFRARVINPTGEEAQAVNEQIELKDNREQVHRFLKVGATVACLASFWAIWHNVLPALNVVNDIPLWSIAKEVPADPGVAGSASNRVTVTLGDLIRSLLFLFVTVAAAKNLPGLLDTLLLRRLPLDRGGRHAVATICRYVLTTVGVLLTLKQIGIDWASMQWMVAAMTVGLGFGLQEIFANFVSGLIILLERPIRLGDFVTVNGETGFVTKIQFRATTITDLDRRELLVPNKKFITDELINWTLSDPITRLVIPIGIAYGSDTSLAHRLLMEVAAEHPAVLKEPESSAVMTAFGDSTLNFELRVFIPRRDEFSQITHELNTAIDRKFRKASIEIAFPQCDVNVRGLEQLANLASRPAA